MPDATQDAPQKVAIIGTGLSGLTTAYLLHNDEKKRYDVTLFEQVKLIPQVPRDSRVARSGV